MAMTKSQCWLVIGAAGGKLSQNARLYVHMFIQETSSATAMTPYTQPKLAAVLAEIENMVTLPGTNANSPTMLIQL